MTDEEFKTRMVENTDRIAAALEGSLEDARAVREVDIDKIMHDAMDALVKTNPVFGVAMREMKARLGTGEQG